MKRFITTIFSGITIASFIICMVLIGIAFSTGLENFTLNGYELLNAVIGAMVVGLGFALPSYIYENKSLSLATKTLIQMGIGFIVLFAVGFYLNWIPRDLGFAPIITWIIIALIIGVIVWIGFYFYYIKDEN